MNKVAIYSGENFTGEVKNFSPTDCIVTLQSRIIKAPIEGGMQSFDNKVRDPSVIKIIGKIDLTKDGASEDVGTIRKMFETREFKFFSATTKDAAFGKLTLQNAVDKSSREEFDLVTYELEFVEVMIVQGSSKKTLDPANSSESATGYRAANAL